MSKEEYCYQCDCYQLMMKSRGKLYCPECGMEYDGN